ncbi:MAG: ComF family protein [Stomatobaculum sp.]|nr:ComF family protein [Stomatobaculum sp.]
MKWSIIPRSFAAIRGSKTASAVCTARDLLTDSLFPRRCPVCGDIVSPPGYQVCRNCFPKLLFVEPPVCMKCGKGLTDESEAFCSTCASAERSFEYGAALLYYDDIMRRAVSGIKYNNRREYIKPFAKMFWLRWGKVLREMNADCLVPVPLHPSRFKKRGFNQAELLARELGVLSGIPVRTDLLFREKRTEAQKELTPDQRIRNLQKAFRADPEKVDVSSVILVDDIYTTGSTAEACTRALKEAGVQKVYTACLCIVSEA